MKRVSLFLFFVLFSVCMLSTLSAQNKRVYRDVRPFEGEAAIGMIINAERNLHHPFGYSLFVEGRWNIPGSRWDLGAQIFAGHWAEESAWADAPTPTLVEHLKPLTLTVYGDYNFRQGRDLSIFVGHGPGLTYMMSREGPFNQNRYLTFSNRAGVEFRHRYRLGVDYRIVGSWYQIFGINFGYVFGGGVK